MVAERLRKDFLFVREEWGYIDRDTGDLRALDIHAERWLWKEPQPRIRPVLNLLVECKQSQLPYVFFLSKERSYAEFPLLVGHPRTVTLTSDDDRSTYTFPTRSVLGLDELPFASDPPYCTTFSKAARKGKDVELSGEESFHGLVLPLMKAVLFLERTRHHRSWYSDLRIAMALGVLDAPMIGVRVTETAATFEMLPWVRAIRHESYESS